MNLNGKTSYFILQVAFVALFLPAPSARAQAITPGVAALMVQQPARQGDSPARGPDQNTSEVEQLKKKVEQLQSVVEQQQRALVDVLKRLGELDSSTHAAVPVTSYKPDSNPKDGRDSRLDAAVAVSRDVHPASAEVSPASSQPVSQEELRADIYQDFVERSLVNNLAPSRSPGFMASGVIDKGVFEYQIGAFNGKGLLANNNTNSPEGAVRLRVAPWKNTTSFLGKGLFFGGAFADGRSLGGTSFRGLTESRSFTYFTPDNINGEHTRANV